jgi:hypothetical protein
MKNTSYGNEINIKLLKDMKKILNKNKNHYIKNDKVISGLYELFIEKKDYIHDKLMNIENDYLKQGTKFDFAKSNYEFDLRLFNIIANELKNNLEQDFSFHTFVGDKNHSIIQNAVQTPDKTILVSTMRHEYIAYQDKRNNEVYFTDGGTNYIHKSNQKDLIDLSIMSFEYFTDIRKKFLWGTYGKTGKEEFKWVVLRNMTKEHIKAILKTQFQIKQSTKEILKAELIYRKIKKIQKSI